MKTKLCMLLAGCMSCLNMSGNIKAHNGVYRNESGTLSIIIGDDSVTMLSCDEDEGALAVCTKEMMTDSFMMINSMCNPGIQALEHMSITYSKRNEGCLSPDVTVRFHLPNTQREMKANIHRGMRDYTGLIRNGVCEITLDDVMTGSAKSFSFTITPTDYVESNPDGQYYGVLYILYPFEIRYEENDVVTIELPSVSSNIFELYFIKGEYIHFTGDGLEWRGDAYHRQ